MDIVLWQHDGFTFVSKHPADRQKWIGNLQTVVAQIAEENGVQTELEITELTKTAGQEHTEQEEEPALIYGEPETQEYD